MPSRILINNTFTIKDSGLLKAIKEESERMRQRAEKVIESSGVIAAWRSIGAEINLVGSARMGLMAKRRDIDFHIYTDPFSLAESFRAMAILAQNSAVRSITFANLLDAEDRCVEWHATFRDEAGENWQIDMIHILKDSRYAGYFERVAERISAVLTPETRAAILNIKFSMPDDKNAAGIRIYRAVIEGGVHDLAGFQDWEKLNPPQGIDNWMP